MQPPDTTGYPHITLEPWKGVPDGFKIPPRVDLSPWFPPAGHQGGQASCVGWAVGYGLMTYRQNLWDQRTYAPGHAVDSAMTFSPAYLYNLAKGFVHGRDELDPGICEEPTGIENILRNVMIGGCVSLKEMSYDTLLSSCLRRPEAITMLKALPRSTPPAVMLGKYAPEQWRYHLAQGQPIVVGLVVTTGLIEGGKAAHGDRPFVCDYGFFDQTRFGHAVVCTGYEDDSTFTFLNSWGPHWGYHGYFKLTLKYLEQLCYGGYVMSNARKTDWPKAPGEPADHDTENGPRVHEKFKTGQHQEINGLKLKLAERSADGDSAVVQLFHSGTDSLVRTLIVRLEQAYDVYYDGRRFELVLQRRGVLGRLISRSTPFALLTSSAQGDAFLRERNATIKRLSELQAE